MINDERDPTLALIGPNIFSKTLLWTKGKLSNSNSISVMLPLILDLLYLTDYKRAALLLLNKLNLAAETWKWFQLWKQCLG